MKKYEVFSERYDIVKNKIGSFTAESDNEAQKIFYKKYVGNPNYVWDYLKMVEVVQERVERIVETSTPDERRNG